MSAKSRKAAIILGVVLLLLAAACILIVLIPKLQNGNSADNTMSTIGSPVKLSFNGGGGDETYTFTLQDGTWSYTDRPDYPITQSYITRIADSIPGLAAQRIIDISDSLSAYGLDTAEYTLTAEDENGAVFSIQIGASAGDSGYYAIAEGTEGICIISSTFRGYLTTDIFGMIASESIPSTAEEDIVALSLTSGDVSAEFKQEDSTWYFLTDSGDYVVEEDYSAIGSDGESHTVRKYLNDISDGLSSMRSSGCSGYGSTDSELAAMGLDDSALTATFTMSDGTVSTFIIGSAFADKDGSTYYYFTMTGLSGVYKMSAAGAEPLFEALNTLGR